MRRHPASERQVQAADPALSTWLSANAGSGKTRVLTDRVARLLLAGCQPQHILCLTYTKAAAAEMQNRLFARLGAWAMLPEPALRDQLRDLGEEGAPDASRLDEARRLFARAIDAPGGLRIQTIHSFCAALLRRFPLEAGVAPGFAEMDDRAATLMRAEIVEAMADGPDMGAVDAVAALMSGEDFGTICNDLCRNSAAFAQPMRREDALRLFDLPAWSDPADAVNWAFDGSEAALFDAALPILAGQSATMRDMAARLAAIDPAAPLPGDLEALFDLFLYRSDGKFLAAAKTKSVPTRKAQEALGDALEEFHAFMQRVADAKDRLNALAAAEKTFALHRFAGAFLPRYEAAKAARGWLDFDDLIARAAALLSDRSVAQWVLFRLDGGIDHILVDEAQDTSPGQWVVIERLAEEFTAGEGARGGARTIFVVGDKKQSIYSFQGADLREFERMQAHFRTRFQGARLAYQEQQLEHSFRSSQAILRLVDCTMSDRAHEGLGGPTFHDAFHADRPGRVDIWPVIEAVKNPEPEHWYDPTDLIGERHHLAQLADRIATELSRMIAAGTRIVARAGVEPLHEGHVLILVQRRSALFSEIIRACKAAGLAVAGADRLKLGAELAVRDLAALLSFLALPEDDLSLAAALRSPLFGWTEAQLYALAQPRGEGEHLWAALRRQAALHPDTLAILDDLRRQADFLRPFELIERVLTRHDGRLRLLARLGPEAEDGIDEMLAQALAFERAQVPSLTGFLVWLETDEVEVKRRLDGGGRAIRVMTVHGAKGLEAPLVILPDTAKRKPSSRDQVYVLPQGQGPGDPVWAVPKADSPAVLAAHRAGLEEAERQERMRLLYVAMTRAESWLIVCAAGDVGAGEDSWYALISSGMDHAGGDADLSESEAVLGFGPVRRLAQGDWPANAAAARPEPPRPADLPPWATVRAPALPEPAAPLSPSDLGGAKTLPGEAGDDTGAAARLYGQRLHLLLEHLPLWPETDWPDIARTLLTGGEEPMHPDAAAAMAGEARRVLTAPDMAPFLAPGALAEVEISACLPELGGRRIRGAIDRLLVLPDRIVALDYKSNALVPATPAEVPEGILRQMGAYAAALAQIYPGRSVETAVFWTATGRLMPLDPKTVRLSLQSATIP